MVEANLGEAIASGTNLRPDTSMPVTRGLQMAEQDDFRQAQLDMKRAAEEKTRAERASKLLTIKDQKFRNPKYSEEFGKYYEQQLPKMMDAFASNDVMVMNQLQTDLINKSGMLKAIDNEEYELFNKEARPSSSRKLAQELYSKGGIQALMDHDKRYWFAPISQVDKDSGYFQVVDFNGKDVGKTIDNYIDRIYAQKYKPTGNTLGSSLIYKVDQQDPYYVTNRNMAFNELVQDDNFRESVLHSNDFKDYYDDYLEEKELDPYKATEQDLDEIYTKFVEDKFNRRNTAKTKFSGSMAKGKGKGGNTELITLPGGGYQYNGYYYTPTSEDGLFQVETESIGELGSTFRGYRVSKGTPSSNLESIKVIKPNIKYLGEDDFEISGVYKNKDATIPIKMRVNTSDVATNFKLDSKRIAGIFGYYYGELLKNKEEPKSSTAAKKETYKAKTKSSSR
jgi:hypothetical protein